MYMYKYTNTSYESLAIVYSMPALRTLSYLDIKALGASCELLSNSTGTEVCTNRLDQKSCITSLLLFP